MKKVLLSLAIVTIATLSANAQSDSKSSDSQFKLDVGVKGGIPLGNFGDVSSFGIGGFLKAAIPASDNIDLSLTAGYTSFSGKTVTILGYSSKYPTEGIVDFIAGGSYKLDGGFHIDAGIGYATFSPGGGGGFAYRAGVGYKITSDFDVTANYNGISATGGSSSYIGIGVSYAIIK